MGVGVNISPALFDPNADYLIRAKVAHEKSDLWDAGDHVRMRIGHKGSFHVLWIARALIVPVPQCLLI